MSSFTVFIGTGTPQMLDRQKEVYTLKDTHIVT